MSDSCPICGDASLHAAECRRCYDSATIGAALDRSREYYQWQEATEERDQLRKRVEELTEALYELAGTAKAVLCLKTAIPQLGLRDMLRRDADAAYAVLGGTKSDGADGGK